MRITNQMVNRMLTGYITDNQTAIYNKQQQVASGKKYQNASEDPLAWAEGARLHRAQASLEQYTKNADRLDSLYLSMDQKMASVNDSLQHASELSVQGSDSTTSREDREVLAEQINGIIEDLFISSNAKHDGTYLFGGTANSSEPFTATRDADGNITVVTYNGNNMTSTLAVDDTNSLSMNLVGSDPTGGIFISDNGDSFATLIQMRDLLMNGETLTDSGLQSDIDLQREHVTVQHAVVGGYMERLAFSNGLRDEKDSQITSDLARVEGIDVAEAVTELSAKQAAYQAALTISARAMDLTILNYV